MINFLRTLRRAKIYEYYYVIILFIVLIQLYFIPSIRLGVITSIVILIVLYKDINRHDLLRNSIINKLVLCYIVYNIFSGFFYIFSGIPVSVFFAESSNSILPIFFFYFSSKEKKECFRFYYITLIVLVISFIIGFYLWMNNSEEYKLFMETTEGPGTGIDFFQSLYGLTATGAFGVIGFLISSKVVFGSNGRKGKVMMILCFVTTILTFRRGSMFSMFFAIVILHYIAYLKFKFLKIRYFIVEVLFIYVLYKYYLSDYDLILDSLVERSSEVSQAVGERSFTWTYAFQDLNFIFGKGLGSVGHKSIGFSKVLIADGNYFKMIAEIGVFGVLIFFSILISSFWNGFKDLRNKYLDLGIIFCICLIAIGSNIFTFQSIAPIFWYAIGRASIPTNKNMGNNLVLS